MFNVVILIIIIYEEYNYTMVRWEEEWNVGPNKVLFNYSVRTGCCDVILKEKAKEEKQLLHLSLHW
jgi:hypothetical protein